MKNNKAGFSGFSLAEALITLLVISIITIATIPVITKKKRNFEGHGKWICTLNSAGQHIMWTNGAKGQPNNPATWGTTGHNYCKFTPQPNARNFAVTIAAGGGGGAAAGSQIKNWTSNFAVEHPGMYNFIAVGAGGHGGGSSDKKDRSAGGGAGAVVGLKVYLSDKVSQIRMQRGAKGGCCTKRDGTKNSGYAVSDANHSKIIAVMFNDSGMTESVDLVVAEGGDGGHGGEHGGSDADRRVSPPGRVYMNIPYALRYPTVNGKSYSYSYKCYGKYGNTSGCGNTSSCANDRNYCSNRMWGIVLEKSSPFANKVCSGGILSKSYQSSFNSFFTKDNIKLYPEIECSNTDTFNRDIADYKLTSSNRTIRNKICSVPGLGGGSKPSRFVCGAGGSEGSKSGSDGYVMANTTYYFSGGGGEAGDSATNVFYPKFNAKNLVVTIGKGGKGGTATKRSDGTYVGAAGQNGGNTSIVDNKNETLLGKMGGQGGKLNHVTNALIDTPGGDGGNTKIYYKSEITRGKGGLAEGNLSNKNGLKSAGYGDGGGGGGFHLNNGSGNGADGMPGIVIIEW